MKKNLVQFMHHSGSIMCKNRRHPPGEEGVSTVSKMGGGNVQGGECLSPYVKCRIMKRINNDMTVEN